MPASCQRMNRLQAEKLLASFVAVFAFLLAMRASGTVSEGAFEYTAIEVLIVLCSLIAPCKLVRNLAERRSAFLLNF